MLPKLHAHDRVGIRRGGRHELDARARDTRRVARELGIEAELCSESGVRKGEGHHAERADRSSRCEHGVSSCASVWVRSYAGIRWLPSSEGSSVRASAGRVSQNAALEVEGEDDTVSCALRQQQVLEANSLSLFVPDGCPTDRATRHKHSVELRSEWCFAKFALEPRDVMPSIELPTHGSKGADVFEACAPMQGHACLVRLSNSSVSVAIAQTCESSEQPLVEFSSDALPAMTGIHVDRHLNRPLVRSSLSM
jgi:hypothetical protein